MTIALIAHDSKKELMVQFCMAYRHILEQHRLLATGTTGRLVEENAGLKVTKFLPGGHGGAEQIVARIAFEGIIPIVRQGKHLRQQALGFQRQSFIAKMMIAHNGIVLNALYAKNSHFTNPFM